jgi:phenylalanyl-tRNA synthetase beta chain
MIVNTKWLQKYIDISLSHEELEKQLTYLGLEATLKESFISNLKNVVVGEILDIQPHPNADRLSLCVVSTGSSKYNVVCGAPNVEKGQKVPLAIVGAVLPNGMEIKTRRISGVDSEGMICAEDELCISDEHEGITVLPEDTPVGIELSRFFSKDGISIDIDLTPNRPDCASHIGVAREISIITNERLRIPEVNLKESKDPVENNIRVDIQNVNGCPRYTARIIKGVKVGPSPERLVKYLRGVGIHSINNIVDASNFVLMETGQPLHTFDYAKISSKKIIVRNAGDGEEVETLDRVKRTLSKDVLLICDAERPVAVAGIMGLANSEISEATTNVLIESAYFDPATIRKGSKYLGLSTEASYRFERGVDPEGVIYALNRVAQIIVEVAGGEICKGVLDEYPKKIHLPEVRLRFSRVDELIGMSFDRGWIVKILEKLGCNIIQVTGDYIDLISPSWRPDLEREVDYIEEVVRIYGMEDVPSADRFHVQPSTKANYLYDLIENLRSMLVSYGYFEVYSNSLVSKNSADFNFSNSLPLKIRNPLSTDMECIRTSLVPGLLQAAQRNINRRNCNLMLFEIGNIQELDNSLGTRAKEILKFSLLLTGFMEEKNWRYEVRESDLFVLKGIIEDISKRFGLGRISYELTENRNFKHLFKVTVESEDLCYIGELCPDYLKNEWEIEQIVYILEGNADILFKNVDFEIRYKQVPIYPSVERDISIIVPENVLVEDVKRVIEKNGGELLRLVRFYDIYQGKNIDKGFKSFTFNLVFWVFDRTLKDEEVDSKMEGIYKALQKAVGAKLR